MKTVRYQLERDIETASQSNKEWLIAKLQEVLESSNDYTYKADIIASCFDALDMKIASVETQLCECREIKNALKEAKALALSLGAEVFEKYGIDRLEGLKYSSITVHHSVPTSKLQLTVTNEEALIQAGFYKTILDYDAVLEAYKAGDYVDLISAHSTIELIRTEGHKRLKINKRRSTTTHTQGDGLSYEEVA